MAKDYFIAGAIKHEGRLKRLAEEHKCINEDGTIKEACLAHYFSAMRKKHGGHYPKDSRYLSEERAFNLYKRLKKFPHCGREGCKMKGMHSHMEA